MNFSFVPLLPLMIVAATMSIVMITLAIRRNHALTFYITLLGLASSLAALLAIRPLAGQRIGILLIFDGFSLFYSALLLASGLAIVVLSYEYLQGRTGDAEEYYILLLGAMLGALVLVASCHFASFFLGLEVLSISLYPLIAYQRNAPVHTEAGVKYLVLSGVSSAFLLFGMALVYGMTGTMDFASIGECLMGLTTGAPMALAGMVFLIVGIGFKVGLVPFHMWTPDVYEGAPAPVAAFIATISKGSMIGLLLRYFVGVPLSGHPQLFAIFAVMAIASMFVGNLLALFQNNIKRLLAYSSIAHFGYLLVAFMAAGPFRVVAVTYYLVAYLATILGAFGVVTLLSGKEHDADGIEAYEGMGRRRPWLGGMLALMFLSLAGMPLTAGFIGKFYVIAAGIDSSLAFMVVVLIVNSAIGLYYYARVIAAIYRPSATEAPIGLPPAVPARIVMAALAALVVWWGVYPAHLVNLIQTISIGH